MTRWYESLFKNFARRYDEEGFTQGTKGEVDFLEREIGRDRRARILDIGCGTGRHAIELARRGYDVTGVDLSADQLRRAREKAREAGVRVRFLRGDARRLAFAGRFDLAIMLCEGAFPLMETDAMNFRILANAHRALAPGGRFVFTTLNGLYPLFHKVKELVNAGSTSTRTSGNAFDLMTFRDRSVLDAVRDDGTRLRLRCDERYYVPSEISWLLASLGFEDVGIFGARLGKYSRRDRLTTEDYEMLVTAVKPRARSKRT